MFYLPNLVASNVLRDVLPWEFKPTVPIPDEVRSDKTKRHAWITNPTTKHCVYSFFEGVNPNLRVTRSKADNEGNPPVKMWGLVADYDVPFADERVLNLASDNTPAPNWVEKTLSGNWRFIWEFEEPTLLPSYEFTVHFLKNFERHAFQVHLAMAGFDRGAWNDPARMFTNSCDWRPISQSKLPKELVTGWIVKAGATFGWTASEPGLVIPLEAIKPELAKKYPSFAEWQGEFELNAQGPTFWVEGSTSPKSAIVRETGIQTFADHAPKSFFSWRDLLGQAFVTDYQSRASGRAVEGIYFDGRHYFQQIPDKTWKRFEKSDMIMHLTAERHVSPKADKSGVTAVVRCLTHIQSFQSVNGCAPFCMQPAGLIHLDGKRFLNINNRHALSPASEPAIWGPNGNLPWVSNWIDCFFDPPEQLPYFLSWASLFYKSAHHQKPRSGQNIFIAGNANVGKTLLSTGVIARLVGGSAEAKDLLMGQDLFGSELFEVPLWTVDDSTYSAERKTQKHFSEMIKRMAANRNFRYHEKFRVPVMVNWQGRVIVTCNRDEESILVLPDLDISILDKIMLFKTADRSVEFPEPDQLDAILKRELPFLARYLLDYQIPEHCKGDSRFGVKAYHEPTLVRTARRSSRTAAFADILTDFRNDFFKVRQPEAKFWEGTAFQLHKQIHQDPTAPNAMRSINVAAVGQALVALKNRGENIEIFEDGESRLFKFYPPEPRSVKTDRA